MLNTVTFRASGALKQLNYGNGRRLTMGYDDNRNQPTSMVVDRTNNSSDKVVDYAYQYYDANGNNNNRIRQITDNIDTAYTTSYLYDDYNRLTNATASAFSRSYGYDPFGNITNFNGVTLNYATNSSGAPATNRLSTDSQSNSYTYDAAGNMTAGAGQSYTYDGANRLKEVGSGGANVYGYDGDGKRVKKTEGGTTMFYVYSSKLGQSVMEVTASSVQRAYVYSGNKLVAMQATNGQFYWLHTDHLGNSRAMTDANGNLTYKGQFDPYGAALTEWSSSSNTNLNNKKFTGYERDNSGLDYANARMYDSARGRFMTPDPIGLKSATQELPQSFNRYSYVHNDPVNSVDPSGLLTIIIGGSFTYNDGNGPDWAQKDTEFWNAIKAMFGEDPRLFVWDGSKVAFYDGYEDIYKWGGILASYINNYKFEDGEKLNIIAHSHGGNVVKVALDIGLNRTVDNLVTLGTPQNYDLWLTRRSEVRNHCNVFSTTDAAQFFGASPYQVGLSLYFAYQSGEYAIQAAWAAWYGLNGLAEDYTELSFFYAWRSKRLELSTRIDRLANHNVSFDFVSHSGLHTPEILSSIKVPCGL